VLRSHSARRMAGMLSLHRNKFILIHNFYVVIYQFY
jgi:hypothetical protein